MQLSRNFSLQELTKSDTAIRKGINNNPNAEQIEKLKLLCENILQPVRDHFGRVKVTSGFRSPELCHAIGSSVNSQHSKAEAEWERHRREQPGMLWPRRSNSSHLTRVVTDAFRSRSRSAGPL